MATAPELLDALLEQRPDVGIVDVRLPPTHTDDGLRAALRARARVAGLPVLILSQYVEQLYARELLAGGFENSDGSYWGRPVDVVPGPDGALYISDDTAGAIYRLAHVA